MYGQPRIVRFLLLFVVLLTSSSLAACGSETTQGGTPELSRAIQNKGSDTLVNVALAWAEAYQKVDPGVSIAVTGGGTGTGIAALINGTVDIANASRQIKPDETAAAEKNNIHPVEIVVAVDALAVIVNPKNPVTELTIQQLADIFTGRITNWKELGGRDAPIVLVSRESNSGTHVYFLDTVIRQGSSTNKDIFAAQTLMMPSSVGITNEVGRNPNAIGYDGLGYVTHEEKTIAVAKDTHSPYVLPSVETASDGRYPLTRNLYMYTAGEPSGVIAEYINWIRGPEGQKIVARLGFVPITGNKPQ